MRPIAKSLFVLSALLLSLAVPAEAVSPNLVLSQVYGGAGCGTAGCSTYKNDYIELFNRGASPVSVNGWSVQYAAATGTTWQVTNLPNVSIPAGGYLLVAEGAGANGVNNLPTPDVTGVIAMSATAAKVALVNTTTALSGACPLGATVIDFVGYGTTANCNEGGANAPAPSTVTSDSRAGGGCTDTDNNSADFAATAPNPRNSATAAAPCGTPLPNLTVNDVSLNEGNTGTTSFTFTVSLSAPAGAGGVTFDIATADSTAVAPGDYTAKSLTAQTIPAGSSTYSFTVLVNGDTSPETNETFVVNVTNVTGANVTDGQGQGTIVNDDAAPNLTINDVSLNEGNAGTTSFTFTVSLSAPAPAGGVTFDIATANSSAVAPGDYTAKSLTGQTIPAGSSTYAFTVLVNGDTTPEGDEVFLVNVTNITNAVGVDSQGQGTIVNDDLNKIHDVQGNGASSPLVGQTVSVEGVVIARFQTTNIQGFFLEEEDADADADPATSEGIFIFCSSCPTAVAEGQRVRATGAVSEFNGLTEITASTAGSVVVTDAGNHLAEVTPAPIDLPIAGVVDDFYEAREGMKVTFVDTLTVSEYFELGRYGQIILYEGGRPRQFTEFNTPNVTGYNAYLDTLSRRQVILDDDNNAQEWYLTTSSPAGPADGLQYVYYPRANGGFSVGTQGTDFFRGGDLVNGLTGVLHWSFAGQAGTDAWRIRPTSANPATFTVANPRPATPPAVGGAIKAVGMNLLNYFTTIDTTASTSTGPCGPGGTLDCRGADSVAELNRQRARAALVICTLNADVYGFAELENTTASASINDLLGAVNASCGGAHPYAAASTGGTLGTDAIRVQQIYRTGILSPVGSPLVDLDPIHSRPPTAQTYDVVDATNPAFGRRFTVIINHLKSKGSSAGLPGDADAGDGAGASNATRTAQASRLLTWINSTVLPAAGDPDVLLLGDFNAYAKEDPVNTLIAGGYTDLETLFHGANAYSYLFDGQLGHLDYGFASASLLPQVTGTDAWHINADEVDLFDYNDEIRDSPGESTFEEKPDGSALTPPRVVFQPGTPYRASDHDPVIVGLFPVADLSITKTDGVTTATPGGSVTYTITASNAGPNGATGAAVADTFPASLTCTWTCVGAGGGTCTASGSGNINGTVNLPVGGSVTYTASCTISAAVTGTLSNTATVTAPAGVSDSTPGNNSATDSDTLAPSADLSITKTDGVTTATPGGPVTYTITASNAGPSNAPGATVADTFPASLTCTWTCVGAGGGTCTASGSGNINGTANLPASGSVTYTASCTISAAASGTLSNTATVAAPAGVTDPVPGNNSATDTDTLAASADLSVTKVDTPDPVTAGNNLAYTITVNNAGPSSAATVSLSDTLPAGTTFVSLSSPGGWSCTTPAVGAGGTVSCSVASLGVTSAAFTLVVNVGASVATGTVLSNTATVSAATTDPTPGNNSGTATTTVGAGSADLSITKVDTPDPVTAGNNLTYTITATNAGPSSASSVSLSDTLPAGTTFVSLSSPGGWSCTTPAVGSGGTVSCTVASLGVTSAAFTLVVAVSPATTAGSTISNTAAVSAATSDPTPGNNSGTATTTVGTGSADLSVTKTDTPDPVTAGNNLTYTVTITNAGPSNATSASLSDTLPAGTTFVSLSSPGGWSCTTPAVGVGGTVSCSIASLGLTSASFTLVVAVSPATAAGATISNTATVSAATTDPTPGNNSATATTTVATAADLSVTKVDTPDPVTAGNNLTYTITVTNAGPSAAASVSLSDTLPTGTTFVSLSSPGGWSCTTPAVGAAGTVSCSVASLGVTSASFTLVVNVGASIATGTVLSNTATVSATTTDPTPGNNSGTATTTVGSGSADLSITKVDTPDPVTAGNNLTYTITVTNAGPSAATSVSLFDTLPAGTTFVSLASPGGWSCPSLPVVGAPGSINCFNPSMGVGSAAFTLVVAVSASAADGSTISNTATVSAATTDPVPGNNSATATTTVSATAGLTLAMTDAPDPVTAGSNLTYTITATNAGPSTAAGAVLSDTVPAGTTFVSLAAPGGWSCTTPAVGAAGTVSCTGSVAPGNAVFTLVVQVGTAFAPNATITNTAQLDSTTSGPAPRAQTTTGSATTTVLTPATITATKTVAGQFTVGGAVTYTVTLHNSGPANQADNPGHELTDILPAELTLVSASASSGTAVATVATRTVTWDGSIPAGGSVTVTIQATVNVGVAVGTVISNQATASYDADGNATNEATAQTDDPGQGGASDPTSLTVVAQQSPIAVPALDTVGLALLAALLALTGALLLRRRTA